MEEYYKCDLCGYDKRFDRFSLETLDPICETCWEDHFGEPVNIPEEEVDYETPYISY